MTTVERVKPRYIEPVKTGFRFRDLLVVLLCLLIFAYCIDLFWNDLFQTINLQNVEPVGTITIKNNTVQRRIEDRVLWDRLVIESPVYLGDLIRVAELSAATLNINGQQLDIGENTLIRIQPSADGEGVQIELSEGSIGITVTEESVREGHRPLQLNMNGRIVETTAGASITASASSEGTAVQVNEGTVTFIEGDTAREMAQGEQLALNDEGVEVLLPSLTVTQPHFNARYEKNSPQRVPVNFSWNRINIPPEDFIRLEVASDRNFTRDVSIYNDLNFSDTSLEKPLDTGTWNWRFLHNNVVLSAGRFTVYEYEEPVNFQIVQPASPPEPPTVSAAPAVQVANAPPEPAPEPPPPPPPPFGIPGNRVPANRQVFRVEQFRNQRNIVFSWSAIQGANAYIVTISQQNPRWRYVTSVTVTGTRWTLADISILERGTFVWQVEAITRNENGEITRRGQPGRNTFTMDIPPPNPVQKLDPGVLYGQ